MAITYLSGQRIQGISTDKDGVPASAGWNEASGMTVTSGTGIVADTSSEVKTVYDLGVAGAITPNDKFVIDFDLTRNTDDYYDHPMLLFRSKESDYADPTTNGENQILLCYWSGGDTGESDGKVTVHVMYRAGGTNYERGADSGGTDSFCQQTGSGGKTYYRMYLSKSTDSTLDVRISAWDSDANRTTEGATGREFEGTKNAFGGTITDWADSDPLRYVEMINKDTQANWTISSWKFWSGDDVVYVGDVFQDSTTPTVSFDFTDVAGMNTDVPVGSQFEETDTRKFYQYGGVSTTYTQTVLDNASNPSNADMVAEMVVNTSSLLYNKQITNVQYYLYNPSSATGTVTCALRRIDGTLVHTFWTKDISTLPTEEGTLTSETTTPYTGLTKVNDCIAISTNSATTIAMEIDINSRPFDGANTAWALKIGSADFTDAPYSGAYYGDCGFSITANPTWIERGTAI